MTNFEIPTLTTDIPEFPTRGIYEPDTEDASTLTFSPEDDDKITRAANWGRSRLLSARAGDTQALRDLQVKLHVTQYQVTR